MIGGYPVWNIWFNDALLYFWIIDFLGDNGIENYSELEKYRKKMNLDMYEKAKTDR